MGLTVKLIDALVMVALTLLHEFMKLLDGREPFFRVVTCCMDKTRSNATTK
jgi:hypothetical protein